MKKATYLIIALLCVTNAALAQAGGLLCTVAGGGTGFAEGVPATAVTLLCVQGLTFDAAGNLYLTHTDQRKVQKVDAASGLITTVAGVGGWSGFSGDGGPATSAQFDEPWSSCIDAAGNIYIADKRNGRVRKVDGSTKIITTIAGGGTSTADGIPATDASFNPGHVVVDASGNLYISATNKVKKVNLSTGIITTYAGNGTAGDTGDGGAATAATISSPTCMTIDLLGNLIIGTRTKVRMINASTGVISTIAGGGTSLLDGIPATSVKLTNIKSLCLDHFGNIYIGNIDDIRMVDAASGLAYKIAGGGTSLSDGTPALSAYVYPEAMAYNALDKSIYYVTCTSKVRKFSNLPHTISSIGGNFHILTSDFCSGPSIRVTTTTYIPGQGVKTYFGDGTSDSGAITLGYITGYNIMSHTYNSTGVYTIKHLLYNGATLIDSVSYPFDYRFCRVLPINMYYDSNTDCVKDATEPMNHIPQKIVVDSNGVMLDTLSCTAGLQYYAYGNPGDIYNFRALSTPAISFLCPSGGNISDTLQTSSTYPAKYFGFNCLTGTTFDLAVYTSPFRRGPHNYSGTILVNNSYCHPVPSNLTMQVGPKITTYWGLPSPISASGGTVTWNTGSISVLSTSPYRVSASVSNYIRYPVGDTLLAIFTINPTSGDVNTTNNMVIRVDTVNASYDPNMVEVTPTCIPAAVTTAELQYTIHFENMGNDTAHNIYVLDTLSSLLDASSLEIVISSAEMYISTMKDLQGRTIVKFNFPNIKLLDSSYHGLCDGMFVFKIKTKAGVAAGTNIPNRAGIYFDDNPVVMTNTAYTTKGCPTLGIESAIPNDRTQVSIYPNPVSNEIMIRTEPGMYQTYTITNTVGEDIITRPLTGSQSTVNISSLPAGVYFVTLEGSSRIVRKFIKI